MIETEKEWFELCPLSLSLFIYFLAYNTFVSTVKILPIMT